MKFIMSSCCMQVHSGMSMVKCQGSFMQIMIYHAKIIRMISYIKQMPLCQPPKIKQIL